MSAVKQVVNKILEGADIRSSLTENTVVDVVYDIYFDDDLDSNFSGLSFEKMRSILDDWYLDEKRSEGKKHYTGLIKIVSRVKY